MSDKILYQKTYLSPQEIVSRLQTKGLLVENIQNAEKILTSIGYYRFKIYLRPFKGGSSKTFKKGASFEKAHQLYRFDDELRDILFSLIGRIEIKIRTRLDQAITTHTNDPFWYLNSQNFSSNGNDHRPELNNKFIKSTDDFAKHYKKKYTSPENISVFHQNMPPFLIMAELTTFGDIVTLFRALNKKLFITNKYNNLLDTLAQEFGASTLDIFNSWLESLRETRNRCAHHSRVWNRNCFEAKGIQGKRSKFNLNLPSEPEEKTNNPTSGRRNKLYSALFVIYQVSKNLEIDRNIKDDFLHLLKKYPEVQKHIHFAGFPSDWQNLKAWNK